MPFDAISKKNLYFTVIEKKTQEESLVYCFNKILVVHTFAAVLKKYDKAFCAPCTNKRATENDDICLWTCQLWSTVPNCAYYPAFNMRICWDQFPQYSGYL